MTTSLNSSPVWLVTGCSTGFGQAIATHVYNAHHNIIATARNVKSLTYLPDDPNVLKVFLDVTSDDSVISAIDAAVKKFGRIDVVVNNAGYGSMCEVEGFPEEEARMQRETNFWGPVRVAKESLRVSGSVTGGSLGFEGLAFHNASKHALEGFTKAVAKELKPEWNINFFILSLGGLKTNFIHNVKFLPRHPAYDDPDSPLSRLIKYSSDPKSLENRAVPEICATVLFDAVTGQHERQLPAKLNLGRENLPLMRADMHKNLKEMDEWETETLSVAPHANAKDDLLDVLQQ
ncbi:NAD(P)-binding protein [Stipitochalara longipes BDJ]|nr:NAD(P)-binding protein [Stipitochalara longipes BDJ]